MTVSDIVVIASQLDEYNLEKLCDYAAFLKYASEREDEADMAAVREREDEPNISFEAVKEELGIV